MHLRFKLNLEIHLIIHQAGYTNSVNVPPNVKYQDRFLKAYKHARERKRGLWGY